MGDVKEIPSVILTEAEHTAVTDALREEAKAFGDSMTREKLWYIYQKVYKAHPHWLEAIKDYFPRATK